MISKITSIRHNFHLYRNKNGLFCYRFVIPRDVRYLFTISEFKRSLHTDNIQKASLSSLLISNIIDNYINNIRNNSINTLNLIELNTIIRDIINKNKNSNVIDTLSIFKEYNLSSQAIIGTTSDAIDNCSIRSIDLESGGTKIGTKIVSTKSISLQEAIKNYMDDMTIKNKWSIRTTCQMERSNNLLLEVLGNISVNDITRDVLNNATRILLKYPKNRNKLAKYRGKSIKELDNIDIPVRGASPFIISFIREKLKHCF